MTGKAFNLAEVLITLGIIGVVSALTLPSLIANYQKKVTVTKVKKVYVTLNNALDRAKVDNGTNIEDWDILTSGSTAVRSKDFTDKFLVPYLNVMDRCEPKSKCSYDTYIMDGKISFSKEDLSNGTRNLLVLNDGTQLFVDIGYNPSYQDENVSRIEIYFDINGKAKPNITGKDIFHIELGGAAGMNNDLTARNRFLPYNYASSRPCSYYTQETHNQTCRKDEGYYQGDCLAAILCNGWEIPNDYPW